MKLWFLLKIFIQVLLFLFGEVKLFILQVKDKIHK